MGVPRRRPARRTSSRSASSARPRRRSTDDGYASLLVSWVAHDEDDPDARLDDWLDGCGCDAWVLGLAGADPLEHAAGWNEHLASDPEAFGAALDEWTDVLRVARRRVDQRGRRAAAPARGRRSTRSASIRSTRSRSSSPATRSSASSRHTRGSPASTSPTACSTWCPCSRREVSVEHRREPGSREPETVLVLDEGTMTEYELDFDVAEVVALFDGDLTLGRAIDRVVRAYELDRREEAELRDDSLAEVTRPARARHRRAPLAARRRGPRPRRGSHAPRRAAGPSGRAAATARSACPERPGTRRRTSRRSTSAQATSSRLEPLRHVVGRVDPELRERLEHHRVHGRARVAPRRAGRRPSPRARRKIRSAMHRAAGVRDADEEHVHLSSIPRSPPAGRRAARAARARASSRP